MDLLQTDFTQDDRCVFSSTLITEHFSCVNATNVVRRGGSEISCGELVSSKKCELVYNNLKQIAISALGVDDDLLHLPHGVIVKIQHGGLLGLYALIHECSTEPAAISNISKLISDSECEFNTLEAIPYESTLDYITSYKIRKRRK